MVIDEGLTAEVLSKIEKESDASSALGYIRVLVREVRRQKELIKKLRKEEEPIFPYYESGVEYKLGDCITHNRKMYIRTEDGWKRIKTRNDSEDAQ